MSSLSVVEFDILIFDVGLGFPSVVGRAQHWWDAIDIEQQANLTSLVGSSAELAARAFRLLGRKD